MGDRAAMEKIGVFMLGSLGDTITAIPALRAILRSKASADQIIVIHNSTPKGLAGPKDILPTVLGIRHFIDFEPSGVVFQKLKLLKNLRRYRISEMFYLAPAERNAYQVLRDRWFFRASGIKRLVGFHPFSAAELYPIDAGGRPARVPHEAVWRLERLRREGIPVDLECDIRVPFLSVVGPPKDEALRWLAVNRTYPDRPLIALCPGGNQPANLWTFERWVSLVRSLVNEGNVEIVIVGGKAEHTIGQTLVQQAGDGISAAGVLSPLGSAALLNECKLVVGLDSGPTHLAAAVGSRCLVLFGAREHPGRWYPIGNEHVVLRNDPPCAGCQARECPVPSHPCMTDHTPQDILAQIRIMAMNINRSNRS